MSFLNFDGFKKKPNAPWSKFYNEEDMNLNIPDVSVYKYFEDKVINFGNTYCLDYYGRKVKYNELLKLIDDCAKGLYEYGVRKGNVVTLCLPNTLEGVIAFFAINKIGAIVNFIHPSSGENEIKASVNEMDSKIIFVIDSNYSKIESIINDTKIEKVILVSLTDYMSFINKLRYHKNKVRITLTRNNDRYIIWHDFISNVSNLFLTDYICDSDKNSPAIILHSGGTTGSPKGVVLSNNNLMAFVESAIIGQNYLVKGDTCLALMPIFHGFGIIHSVLFPLCIGMNVILRPKFDVKEYCEMIVKYKPQILMGVPTLFESLLEEWDNDDIKLDFIKCALVGGDTLKAGLRENINKFFKKHNAKITVCAGYGLSEAVCGVVLGNPSYQKGDAIGIPLPGIYVGIFSPEGKEVPYGEDGEICVCGPTVMLGYYNNEKETNIALHVHDDGNVWLHTGDIGSMDEEGYLSYTNRSKRIIISSGYNIYPIRIEKLLETHPSVMLCSVVGVPDKHKMEVPKAFIVLKKDFHKKEFITLELKRLCKKNLPKYSWPVDYVYMEKLPTTKVGKIDFKKLQESSSEKEND
ncbi:MAG: acyl--CoA ligase [Clostridiales bacterium]|nr:acyl--CoA ligase [Clostridiales bacterium]